MVRETYIRPGIRSEFIDATSTLGVRASGGDGLDPTAPNNAGHTDYDSVVGGLFNGTCFCYPPFGW